MKKIEMDLKNVERGSQLLKSSGGFKVDANGKKKVYRLSLSKQSKKSDGNGETLSIAQGPMSDEKRPIPRDTLNLFHKSEKLSKYEPIAKTLITVQNMQPGSTKFERVAKSTASGKFIFTGNNESGSSMNAPVKLNHIASSTHQNFYNANSNMSTNTSSSNGTQVLGSPKIMKYPAKPGVPRGLVHRSLMLSNSTDGKGLVQANINNAKINENATAYKRKIEANQKEFEEGLYTSKHEDDRRSMVNSTLESKIRDSTQDTLSNALEKGSNIYSLNLDSKRNSTASDVKLNLAKKRISEAKEKAEYFNDQIVKQYQFQKNDEDEEQNFQELFDVLNQMR